MAFILQVLHFTPRPLALVAEIAETALVTERGRGRGGMRNQAEFTKGVEALARVGNQAPLLDRKRYMKSETSFGIPDNRAFRLCH